MIDMKEFDLTFSMRFFFLGVCKQYAVRVLFFSFLFSS